MKEKIYLVPGLMTDERLWSRIKPYLQEFYDLVHLPIPKSENFDEIVEILDKEISEERVNILGFSLGGYIASYYAMKYTNKVNRLFVVAVTPSATNKSEELRRREKIELMQKEGFSSLSHEKVLSLIENKNHNDNELISIIQKMYDDLGMDTFISQMNSTFNRVDIFEELCKLQLPIKFFVSLNDRLLNQSALNRLLNENHNMTVITRNGTSHNIPLEEPEHLSSLIKKWMKM